MDPLYWSSKETTSTLLTKEMAMVSALTEGICARTLPQSYQELENIVPDDDPITPMVTIYAMLIEDSRKANFIIFDSLLHLTSEDGSITLDDELDVGDGPVEDITTLHLYSPLYRDVPDSVEALSMTMHEHLNIFGGIQSIVSILTSPFEEWCRSLISLSSRIDISHTEGFNIILRSISLIRIRQLMEQLVSILGQR